MWNDGTVHNEDMKTWAKVLSHMASISPKERKEMLAITVINVTEGESK